MRKQSILLSILGSVSLGIYVLMNFIGPWGLHFKYYLIAFTTLFAIYLAGVYVARRNESKLNLGLIVILAGGFYLAIIGTKPHLSDDIYRYLWEGKMQLYGFNPYATPPNAPELTGLRDGIYAKLHGEPRTAIYPPLAQLFFRLFAGFWYSPAGFKVLLFPFFLGSIWFLVRILQAKQLNPNRVLVFAWNPLVIIECAGSGHLDIMGTCLLLGALALVHAKRFSLSAVCLGAAAMAKFLPAVFLPFFWQRAGKKRLPFILIFAGLVVVLYLPFIKAGSGLFGSLGMYTAKWEFNCFSFRLFMGWFGRRSIYLVIAGLGLLALTVYLYYKNPEMETALFVLSVFILLASPALFPWYLVWLVPFCLFNRSLPFILLTGLVNLSYSIVAGYLTRGIWVENGVLWGLEYAGLGAAMVIYYRKDIRHYTARAGEWIKKGRLNFKG